MSNAIISQAISRSTVAAALQAARTEAAAHKAWMTAINRAALNLEACGWQFDGDTLVITSATTKGTRYHVDCSGCDCKAGKDSKPCWHRAARRLLRKAAELATVAPVATPRKSAAQVEREAAELFG